MSTNLVVVAGVVERLLYLFSQENPEQSGPIAEVNHELRFIQAALAQIIENADADDAPPDSLMVTVGMELMRLWYNFEDAVESCMPESKSRRNGFLNRIFRRSTPKMKVEKLCKEIIDTMNNDSYNKIHGLLKAKDEIKKGAEGQVFMSEPTATDIVRMEDAEKDLVSALTEGTERLNLVSVCGMPGIGKTTLARKIYEDPKLESYFSARAWVSVSQECLRSNILLKIHSQFFDLSTTSNESEDIYPYLAEDIYQYLLRRKYLIVLDDIWEADTWFSLGMVFPDNQNGSRILITSRRKDVAIQVGCEESHIHIMRPLTDDESWKLLRHNLSEEGVKNFGEKIMSASGCLPLAIVALASSVSKMPLKEWKWHLEELYTGRCSPMFYALDLSYKNLPNHLRVCLLYLGTYFPGDTEIEMDTACQLLIAEGLVLFVEDKRTVESMMDVAALYLSELDNRSLVQIQEEEDVPGKRRFKSFRINKVIGDFCKNQGKKCGNFWAIDLGDVNESMSRADRVAIFLNEYESSYAFFNEKSDYLRSLSFFNPSRSGEGYIRPRQIPSLDNFIRLRVLNLYAVDFKQQKLPKGMEKLVYLRYLSLRECCLKELCASIGKMIYLQILDLRVRNECQIIIQDVLDGLKSLRHLYLPLACRTPKGEKIHMGSLQDLELLENFNTSLCNVEDLLKLTNLTRLTVTAMGDVSEIKKILAFASENSSQLRSTSLNLRNFDCYTTERLSVLQDAFNSSALHSLGVEGYLKELPIMFNRTSSNLTEIVLNGSKFVEDPMQILQELPRLRILVLEIEAYNGTNMYCSSLGFPELRYLKLSKLYKLQDWLVENKAMPNLCTLVIENCRNLQMLPEGLRFSAKLRKLEIVSMSDEFVGRIQRSYEIGGGDLNIRNVQTNVKVNGRLLILKERQQEQEEVKDLFELEFSNNLSDPYAIEDQGDKHFWNQYYLS